MYLYVLKLSINGRNHVLCSPQKNGGDMVTLDEMHKFDCNFEATDERLENVIDSGHTAHMELHITSDLDEIHISCESALPKHTQAYPSMFVEAMRKKVKDAIDAIRVLD